MKKTISSVSCRGLKFFLFLLFVLCCVRVADAGVTLVPRVDSGGDILNGITAEDYVYFGSFKHRLETSGGLLETAATPVLWRVTSTDVDVNPTKATLLSHYLVDAMAYQSTPRGDSKDQHTWEGSELQLWLNGAFLTDFTSAETAAIVSPSPDTITGSKMTLPSGSVDNTVGGFDWVAWSTWSYEDSDIKSWFGDNDYTGVKTYTNARKAHFKGATFDPATQNGWYYWMRSPVSGYAYYAWYVYNVGNLNNNDVLDTGAAVRPACFLNLESVIFKSGSDLSSTPAGVAGEILNPYMLYVASADYKPSGLEIDNTKLTVSFDQHALHAYTNATGSLPVANFTVSADNILRTVSNAAVNASGKLEITLGSGVTSSQFIQVHYAYATGDADGIVFPAEATALKSFTIDHGDPAPDPDPGKIPVTIDDDGIASVTVSGTTLTISWLGAGKQNETYDLNQYSVTVTYGENRFTVELTSGGDLVVTGDGALLPDGTTVVLTAADTSTALAVESEKAAHQRGASYALGEAPAAITGGKCVFTFPAEQISQLPNGTYDLTFATKSGANPAFSGTFALGYVHDVNEPTSSGGGVGCDAGFGLLGLLALGGIILRKKRFWEKYM